jgi:hypothetical protein
MDIASSPIRVAAALACLSLAWLGCGDSGSKPSGMSCAQTLDVAGLVVEIRDSRTPAPAALGAQGSLQDGSHSENLVPYGIGSPGQLLSLAGAFNRPGTYDVEVRKSGYVDWSARGVSVVEGACGVVTVTLQANLTPTN